MSDSYISIKDANSLTKKIRTFLNADAHSAGRVLCDDAGDALLTANGNLPVAIQEGRSLSIYRNLDVDETGIAVKASAGSIYSLSLSSTAAGALYVKLYNKATAPTVGTDTPVLTFRVLAGQDRDVPIPADGIPFALGIGIGCVSERADSGTTGAGANEMLVNLTYE